MNNVQSIVQSFLGRYGVSYFFGQPADTITFWFLLAAFVLYLLFAIAYGAWLNSKSKKLKPYKAYAKSFFWTNFSLSLLGLVHLFARYEDLPLFSWRFWMYLLLAIILAFNGWFFVKRRQQLDDEIETFIDKERKQKWLKKKK